MYRPLCAPLTRNVTLRVRTAHAGLQMTDRTLACSGNLFQRVCICTHAGIASCDYKSRLGSRDVHAEPIPLHPPSVREYCLVSCLPLFYMLAFSRLSGLTSCLWIKRHAHLGGLVKWINSSEEDDPRGACRTRPTHMYQCNQCYRETSKQRNVQPK